MRRAANLDKNQKLIESRLAAHGIQWKSTASMGSGFPDGVAARKGRNVLVEIKDPSKPPSKRQLTDDEKTFHSTWVGDVIIAFTASQIVSYMRPRGAPVCECELCLEDERLLAERNIKY